MAPSWAEYRALAHRVAAVAECGEAAGEEPSAELMRAMHDYLDNRGPVRPPSKASARRLNPPTALDGLSDDLVMRMFSRAPFMTHGKLHVVCRRLKTLLRSPEFGQQRVESGLVEYGLVVAGGERDGRYTAKCSMFTSGRWRPIAPLSGIRRFADSAIAGASSASTVSVLDRLSCAGAGLSSPSGAGFMLAD